MVISSEAIGQSEGVEKVWAHLPERSCLCYSHDGQHIYTGGDEGQVFVYSLDGGGALSVERSERQRMHRGGVLALAAGKDVLASVGTDGALVLYGTTVATLKERCRLAYRATLPLHSVSIHPEGKAVACAGENMELVIVDLRDNGSEERRVVKSAPHARPITSVAFDPMGAFVAAADMSGAVRIYRMKEDLEPVRVDEVRVTLPTKYMPRLAWSPDGSLLAVTMDDGIKIVARSDGSTWSTAKHLLLTDVHRETAGLVWSAEGNLLLSHDRSTIALWAVNSSAGSPWAVVNCESAIFCLGICPSDPTQIAFIDKEGQLNRQPGFLSASDLTEIKRISSQSIESKKPTKVQVHKKKEKKHKTEVDRIASKYIDRCRDDDTDDEDEEVEEDEEDRDMIDGEEDDEGGSIDLDNTSGGELDLDSLDDYGLEEDEEEAKEEEEAPAQNHVVLPSAPVHVPFQPCASSADSEHRYLAWNHVGIITSRLDDAGYRSVDIDFHDKLSCRPIRFIDDYGYTRAALSRSAALFASEGGKDKATGIEQQAILHYIAFETWGGRATWSVPLEKGEKALAIAVDDRAAYVATSNGWLRVFSPAGIQLLTLTYGHDPVTMVAGANRLLLVLSQAGRLLAQLYTLTDGLPHLLAEAPLGSRADRSKLTWAGIAETGLVSCYDATGVMYLFADRLGHCWTPVADFSAQLAEGTTVWPVLFDRNEVTAILCKNGETQPAVLPRPIPVALPLKLPMLLASEPEQALLEPVLRTSLLSGRIVDATHGLREKDLRRLNTASDKNVLELIMLALKADKPARALELCGLFYSEKSYELAVQLARHHRLLTLADRMDALREEFLRRKDNPMTITSDSLLKQRQTALASLSLAEGPSMVDEELPRSTRQPKRSRVDLAADSADAIMADAEPEQEPSSLPMGANTLEPEPVAATTLRPAEKKPRGLAEMLSRLSNLASNIYQSPTKASTAHVQKENVPAAASPQKPAKNLKQASLASIFGKKPSSGPTEDQVEPTETPTTLPNVNAE